MRLLADQNIPRDAVDALREEGHDVIWVETSHPGANDDVLLDMAANDNRVVLTFDKDFGELAFHARLPASCGVILLRITPTSPSVVTSKIVRTLRTRGDWQGHFAVVEDARVRMRPLPQMGSE